MVERLIGSGLLFLTSNDVDVVIPIQWSARSRTRLELHGAFMDWTSTLSEVRLPFAAIISGFALAHEIELEGRLASLIRLEDIDLRLGVRASAAAGGLTMIALWKELVLNRSNGSDYLTFGELGGLHQWATLT